MLQSELCKSRRSINIINLLLPREAEALGVAAVAEAVRSRGCRFNLVIILVRPSGYQLLG